ncbi:MAG TPA: DUF4303 domain-containing protein [Actinocatenispora sp.]
MPLSETDLADALADATRAAVTDLYRDNPGHTFYYVALATPGEAFGPALSAWSREALVGPPDADDVRYPYADSPFSIVGEDHLTPVRDLFAARAQIHGIPDDDAEYALRMRAIETALHRLDAEGLYGSGEARTHVLVLADVVPGDPENPDRARRLNPPGPALDAWLAWLAWTDGDEPG